MEGCHYDVLIHAPEPPDPRSPTNSNISAVRQPKPHCLGPAAAAKRRPPLPAGQASRDHVVERVQSLSVRLAPGRNGSVV